MHSLGHVAFYVWQCKLWFKFIKISHRQTDRQTTEKKRKKRLLDFLSAQGGWHKLLLGPRAPWELFGGCAVQQRTRHRRHQKKRKGKGENFRSPGLLSTRQFPAGGTTGGLRPDYDKTRKKRKRKAPSYTPNRSADYRGPGGPKSQHVLKNFQRAQSNLSMVRYHHLTEMILSNLWRH